MKKAKQEKRKRLTTVKPDMLKQLGKLIARARKKKGLTQLDLFGTCGMYRCHLPVAVIARIEKGTRDISFFEFEVIDKILGVREYPEYQEIVNVFVCDYDQREHHV